jgi:tetratricopeptide (TPR) repeat protein/thiol-disulfide isomerase/thioredoxin
VKSVYEAQIMKIRIQMGMLLLALAASPRVFADPPTLNVGDPAPKLQNGKWVQGDPVQDLERDKAYLVEFWATWCGPCRVSIPHLNEIHLKFKDKGLVVVGQDCWEQDDALVAPFVKTMGENMTYRVALDDKKTDEKGVMALTWMAAAGRNGIPSAFLIGKDGRIAWIGHPMELKDSVIEEVLAGKFDLQNAATEYARQIKNQAQLNALWQDFNTARQAKKWDEALAKLDDIEKLTPQDQRFALGQQRFFILITKKDYNAAYKLAEQMSDAQPENAGVQNELAWKMVSDVTIEKPDLELADKIATRAVAASKSQDADILDTLACVLFMEGKQDRAVALEEQAANLSEGSRKQMFQKTLESYKKGTNKPDVLGRQAAQFQEDGKPAEAEAVLREELALEQKLWETNLARWAGTVQTLAGLLLREHKSDDAEKLFAATLTPAIASQKESAALLRDRGNMLAARGRWKEAAADFTKVIALTPDNHFDYFLLAALLVQCGDQDDYQRLCASMLARFGGTSDPVVAERMARSCLITTHSGADLAAVSKIADLAVTNGKDHPWRLFFQYTKGLAEYRQGRFADAAESEQASTGANEAYLSAGADLVLAMAQFQLKQPDPARASLDKGAELIASKMPRIDKGEIGTPYWNDWIINVTLLREARELMGLPTRMAQAPLESAK